MKQIVTYWFKIRLPFPRFFALSRRGDLLRQECYFDHSAQQKKRFLVKVSKDARKQQLQLIKLYEELDDSQEKTSL